MVNRRLRATLRRPILSPSRSGSVNPPAFGWLGNQVTLIRIPEGQRVMNVYGGDKGEGGVWAIDAGKVPTRFLAIKPKEKGVHTTLHVISNTGQEISFFVEEVTGVDSQFDAEVDVDPDSPATPESQVNGYPPTKR